MSASWARFNGVPLYDVMKVAFWRVELRQLCGQADDLYSQGPVVVAQKVVS